MEEIVTLRPVRLLDDVTLLWQACWPSEVLAEVQFKFDILSSLYHQGRGWGLVALVGKSIAGFGQLTAWGALGEISNLIVGWKWRGRGIGTSIIRALLDLARQRGLDKVEIGALVPNSRALALYRRLGFGDGRHRLLDVGNGPESVIYLSMNLPGPTQE